MLGSDVEHFFIDKDGRAVPSLKVLSEQTQLRKRTMVKKLAVDIAPQGYTTTMVALRGNKITEDGLAVEFTTKPGDTETLIRSIAKAIEAETKMAKELGLEVSAQPVVWFDWAYLKTQPELRILGCNPDLSAFSSGEHRPYQDPRKINWRSSGAHVHFSFNSYQYDNPRLSVGFILACDATLGLADVVMANDDLAKKRRELYGQPGKYRIQKWGLEYRTPTSAWTTSPEVARKFLGLAQELIRLADRGVSFIELFYPTCKQVAEIISNCDQDLAEKMLEHNLSRLGLEGDFRFEKLEGYSLKW